MQRFDRHQEADTRIAVHIQHALDKGCKQVFVRTKDTDVLVILIGLFHGMIASYPSTAIWIGLGMENMPNTSLSIPTARFLDLKHLGHALCCT